MKNLNQFHCTPLTPIESQQIDGGSENSLPTFWQDFTYLGSKLIQGFSTFSTEGGNNASLSVK